MRPTRSTPEDFGELISIMEARRQHATPRLSGRDGERWRRILASARFGVMDPNWLPGVVKANGRLNLRLVEDAPTRPTHNCPALPSLQDIPAAVARVAGDTNRVLRLRALGVVLEDRSAWRISQRIRGVMRVLWLDALWHGMPCFELRKRLYHPDDVKGYWPLALRIHHDGEAHADALAYLRALCEAYAALQGKEHAGRRFLDTLLDIQERHINNYGDWNV